MRGEAAVISGLGMTTPVGADVASSWSALLAGHSGVRRLEGEQYAQLPVRVAAPAVTDPAGQLERIHRRRLDRSQQFVLVAAREAWKDAGFDGRAEETGLDPERVGVQIGSGIGGISTTLAQYDAFRERGWAAIFPYTVTMTMPNAGATAVSLEIGARAGSHAPVSACATGAEAIGHAVGMIRSGRADVVVAGGGEAAIHPFTLGAFAAMRALSRRNEEPERASRPFDSARDGFVMGEGAGVVIIESATHAAARGRRVYAEVCGVGFSSDAFHIARADPSGAGAAMAIRRALADAGVSADQVGHVNAHATSTQAGDVAEARAISQTLPADCVVTSTKSVTGHLLGGAGAVEAIATVLALVEGSVPPTANLENQDRDITLDIVTGRPRKLAGPDGAGPSMVALSNSFGFGGHNVTLAFRRV